MAISGDIKLDIYNGALLRLGERRLASLSEAREPRRVLDQFWGTQSKLVSYALERGDWNFALRAVEMEPTSTVETSFGWTYAYLKPEDFRRMSAISADERFGDSLTAEQYADEAGYFLNDISPCYLRYVSDDDNFGFDSGRWTEAFKEYLEVRLAWLSCIRIANSQSLKQQLEDEMKKALSTSKSVDAMDEGTKFLPTGNWARSRSSRSGFTREKSRSIPS